MDVAAFIKELLGREQHVFVPGLGTFSIRKTTVGYDKKQHTFYPPKNSIEFFAEEKQDDKLEKYISGQKNISQQAAGYFIEKFVDQLKKEANTKNIPVKEALFPAGQNPDASFNEGNFGLPPIRLSALKTTLPVEENEITADKYVVPKQDDAEKFYKDFSTNLPQAEPKLKTNTSFWVAIILLLAVCCLGFYALYFNYPNIFKGLSPQKQATVIAAKVPAADTSKTVAATIEKETIKDTMAKAAADTPAVSAKTIVPAPLKTKNDTVKTDDPDMVAKSPYEIIGASFKTLKGAKTFLSQLKSKGMRRAKILGNTSGKQVLITFGSYPDKASALVALEKLRAKDVHSEAYIQHYLK